MLRTALLGVIALAFMQPAPDRAAIIADDPPAAPQRLAIRDIPLSSGPTRSLFNGRDLTGWTAWLGYADSTLTFRGNPGATPLGTSADSGEIFSVVTEDGAPAIRAGGRYWGSLAWREDLGGYHLHLDYKWGPAGPGEARNNGIVYHSGTQPGAVFGTWRTGVELQLQHGSNGMVIPMGNMIRTRTSVAQDMSLIYPHRRFRLGGRQIDLANGNPAYSVEAANNAERPAGQWNRIDLYVLGDRAVHVVNGVPVMVLEGIATLDPQGRRTPLTHGRIQLQAEGATVYFRNIRVTPIRRLPRIISAPIPRLPSTAR